MTSLLSLSQQTKQEADSLLQSNKFTDALHLYQSLIDTLGPELQKSANAPPPTGLHLQKPTDEFQSLFIACRLNISLVYMKQHRWHDLLHDVREVVKSHELSAVQLMKVMMRKIEAMRHLREEEADGEEDQEESEEGSVAYDAEELIFDYRTLFHLVKTEKLSDKSIPKEWRDDTVQLEREWIQTHSCAQGFLAQIALGEEEAGLQDNATTKSLDERIQALVEKSHDADFEFGDVARREFIQCFDIEEKSLRGITSRLVDWVWTWYRSTAGEHNHPDEDKLNVLQATGLMRDMNLLLGATETDIDAENLVMHTEEIVDTEGYLSRDMVHV